MLEGMRLWVDKPAKDKIVISWTYKPNKRQKEDVVPVFVRFPNILGRLMGNDWRVLHSSVMHWIGKLQERYPPCTPSDKDSRN